MATINDHPVASETRAYSPSASIHVVETLGKGGSAVLIACTVISAVFAGLALGVAGRAMDKADLAVRDARVANQELIYLRATMNAQGVPTPVIPKD